MSKSVYTRTASGKTIRKKGERGPRFVQLFHWMINMPVWHSLSPRAVVAYLEFAKRYDGTNNGRLHLSARELAEAWNWSKGAASYAIKELVEKGFIEITRTSGFNVKDRKRQAAEYRLTAFFCNLTQRSASKTFSKWRPPENISRFKNRDTTVHPSVPRLKIIQ
jgi:MarR family